MVMGMSGAVWTSKLNGVPLILLFMAGVNAGVPIQRAVALEKVLAPKVEKWNTSFSVGIYSANQAWVAAVGLNDRRRGTQMEPNLRFPVGSVTKPYTCALIMQAREKGLIDIDAPISKYVDGILYRQNKTSMLELWNNDTNVSKITARRLMGMRAGLHEYNDSWYHEVTLGEPHHDVTPYEILHRLDKTWVAEPGALWSYASTGYELLGLALTAVYGLESWEDLDQMSVFGELREEYTGTSFPGRGLCSKDPLIIHQYANTPYRWGNNNDFKYTFWDIVNTSCLNGWTCGNVSVMQYHHTIRTSITLCIIIPCKTADRSHATRHRALPLRSPEREFGLTGVTCNDERFLELEPHGRQSVQPPVRVRPLPRRQGHGQRGPPQPHLHHRTPRL